MKRWLFLMAVLLLLCGCAAEPEETTIPTEPPETTATEPPTEPVGYYDPDSALEAATDGAVRVYPMNRNDCYGLVTIGSDLLLLSGSEVTTLTRLTGEGGYVAAVANLGCYIGADSPAFQSGAKGVTYYDELHRELVFLDTGLSEVSRVSLPDTITGTPALSKDRKTLYYCTADTIRAIDLETGLDRLLREAPSETLTISSLHMNDTILQCHIPENNLTIFISVSTGETLFETPNLLKLRTDGDAYFAVNRNGAYRELLTGTAGSPPLLLIPMDYQAEAAPVRGAGALVQTAAGENGAAVLHYYDLTTGCRTAMLPLPDAAVPHSFQAEGEYIWFLRRDESYGSDTLCRWDIAMTATGDDTTFLHTRHTADNPDLDALAVCMETAAAISQTHGVDIRLWTGAADMMSAHCETVPEYIVPLTEYYLEVLVETLGCYPDGFLKEAASGTADGLIHIAPVRSIRDDTGNAVSGLHCWDDRGNAFIAVVIGPEMPAALHNALFRMVESRVMSRCSAYDSWAELNPEGFSYGSDADDALFAGDSRAFIDRNAASSAREDRATIMEYAMTAGNEAYFASPTMQAKLRQLCLGIREAFALKEGTFLWEQYLSSPIP